MRFIGTAPPIPGEAIGIELDVETRNGHDGRGFFTAKPGYGFFAKPHQIVRVLPEVSEFGSVSALFFRMRVEVNKVFPSFERRKTLAFVMCMKRET